MEDSLFPLSVSLWKTHAFGNKSQGAKEPWLKAKPSSPHQQLGDSTPSTPVARLTDARLRSEMQSSRTAGLWPGLHKAPKSTTQ